MYSYKGRYSYEWIFDPDVPPPAELHIYHNTHPPFFDGLEASKLKARLRQDFALKGKAAHGNFISAFSGLVICAHCGMSMGWRNRDKVFASCEGRWYRPPACDRANTIYETAVREALDLRLREMIASGDLRAVSPAEAATPAPATSTLRAEITAAQRELSGLLRDKANTTDLDVLNEYTDLIAEASARVKAARAQLERVQAEATSDDTDSARHRAAQEIIRLTVDGFWQLPALHQNRLLHQLFGRYRLVADERTIVGIAKGRRMKHVP